MVDFKGSGWRRDPPSAADYTKDHELIRPIIEPLGVIGPARRTVPPSVDMRSEFGPVVDQGWLSSCTACTSVALFEHHERAVRGKRVRGSVLFQYKAQRNLIGEIGDVGSFLRTGMAALTVAGVCPNAYWPYVPGYVDVEPPAFCYAVAGHFEALRYYRLDPPDTEPDALLTDVKSHLAARIPAMFGVTLFTNVIHAEQTGCVPLPFEGDTTVTTHALVAVGYDDHRVVYNVGTRPGQVTTCRGALLVRNSWGPAWGLLGHAWLPYEYVKQGHTKDWWCLISTMSVDL
jgi:C1A family cysteine protease